MGYYPFGTVTDVIVISVDGKDTAYFCDSFGFTEMPEFFREKEIGLRDIVDRFITEGNSVIETPDGEWRIAGGGYDLVAEIYHYNTPVCGIINAVGGYEVNAYQGDADVVKTVTDVLSEHGITVISSVEDISKDVDISDTAKVSDLEVGDIIMYDGARREVEEISTDRIKMKDLDAPDYGGILLGTSDVLAYDGWQEDMESKGFEIISKAEKPAPAVDTPEQAEPEDKGPVSIRKVGDFYEMYGKNAEIGEEVLGLRMLSKNGQPMVGFPDHVKDEYSAKLREAGYTVLIEQAFELNPPKRDKDYSLEISTTSDAFDEPYCIAKFDADGDFIDYYEDADGHIQTFTTIVDALYYAEKHNLDVKNDMEEIPENLCHSLNDVVSRFFGTDCSIAKTVKDTWRITVADGDKVGELFCDGEPDCAIYDRGDKMEIESYSKEDFYAKLLRAAMLEHNPDKPVEIVISPDAKETPEKSLISLEDVIAAYFNSDYIGNETPTIESRGGIWKLSVEEARNGYTDPVIYHNDNPVCSIHNGDDTFFVEPYQELNPIPNMVANALRSVKPDKHTQLEEFQHTFETPLDKAKWLINDFCEAEYREGADFSDLHNVGLAFTTLTDDELPIQVTADLIDFKITHEFDGEIFDTEQYDSIEYMIENGLTDLDFSDLVSVPYEVIERHTADRTTIYIEASEEDIAELREHLSMNGYDVKWSDDSKSFDADSEQTAYIETILEDRNIVYSLDGAAFDNPEQSVPLMSDASEVKDISSPDDDVPAVTLKYEGDAESLDEIKDKALSLGATVIVDNAEGVISIDTYENHKAELDGLAYELGVMAVDDVPAVETPAQETADIDKPLFTDASVIDEIQRNENADVPFWEMLEAQGEQLSLFGDPEPLTTSKPAHEKPKSEFAKGPVVDGVQVYEALAAEIDRGTGFVHGKLRVQDFYEEKHPTVQQLADFLKKEYGTGGHSGEGKISLFDYNSQGITFSFENGEKFRHSWYNVATMTESRLKDDTYLSAEQKAERAALKAEKAEEQSHKIVEVGDRFRHSITGEVSEVVSLTGALPFYTDECTITTDKGSYATTENITYDKLLNSGLYEYIGKAEPEKEQSSPVKPEKAEVTPDNSAVAPEAEKPEIPTVKNLSQLKKAIKPGMMFEITDHLRPECIGERRVVTGVTTVDFTSRKLNENGEPTGKDLHMEFDRAKNWTFDGGELTSRLDNGDMLMSFHFIDSLEREQTVQAEKEPEIVPDVDAVEAPATEITAPDKGENFTITDDNLGDGGAKTKFRANVNAIKTLKTLEREKRPATAEEKETLSKYVGWGALAKAFVTQP